jgi:hypothetical protein
VNALARAQGTWGNVQGSPTSPSQVESWSQSSWFKLFVVLVVAAVVTGVVALAWVTVPSLHHKHHCDVVVAQKLRDDIHAATPEKGKNYVERFYHQDLCFSNTTAITIPAGVSVNISAEPRIKLKQFRFVVSASAQLHLANVILTGANWTGEEGGAAAAGLGSPAPPAPPSPPAAEEKEAAAKAEAASGGAKPSEEPRRPATKAQVNTTFMCVNCTFDHNVQWTTQSVAKGGAVYVDGKTANFECHNCEFVGNTARAIGAAGSELLTDGSGNSGENATVHGGAIYVGQGNITLISPRFKDNYALCAVSALKAGCTRAGDDVRPTIFCHPAAPSLPQPVPQTDLSVSLSGLCLIRPSIAPCLQVYLESGAVELGCKELAHGPHGPACGLHAQCEDYTHCGHHADKTVLAPCGVLCHTNHSHRPAGPPRNHSRPPPPPR